MLLVQAACFASPIFTSVLALGVSFAASVLMQGDLHFEFHLPLKTALGFALVSIVRHLVLVPLVHKWQFGRIAAVSMIVFYVGFQVCYVWTIAATKDQ